MAAQQINLTEFIQKLLAPRLEISSRVWHALLEQKQQGAGTTLVEVTDLNEKIKDAKKRVELLQQQFLVILEAAGIKHDVQMCITPDTDPSFHLWLAQHDICADTPDLANLNKQYLVWRNQNLLLM